MNAVIDEDLPRSFAHVLSNLGFTAFDIRDYGLRGKPDISIFQFAQQKKAILFSADLGFANILHFKPGTHSGICILRFPNTMPMATTHVLITALLKKLIPEDYKGNLIIVSPKKIRIRRAKSQPPN